MSKKRAPVDAPAEPAAKAEPFGGAVAEVKMKNRGLIGQTVFEDGVPIAQVRLATGITLSQFCAAVRQGKAGE